MYREVKSSLKFINLRIDIFKQIFYETFFPASRSDHQGLYIKFQREPLFAGEFNLFPLGAINCPYPEAKDENGKVLLKSISRIKSLRSRFKILRSRILRH